MRDVIGLPAIIITVGEQLSQRGFGSYLLNTCISQRHISSEAVNAVRPLGQRSRLSLDPIDPSRIRDGGTA